MDSSIQEFWFLVDVHRDIWGFYATVSHVLRDGTVRSDCLLCSVIIFTGRGMDDAVGVGTGSHFLNVLIEIGRPVLNRFRSTSGWVPLCYTFVDVHIGRLFFLM